MPYSVSGITERNYHGTGLVVDAAARPRRRRSQHGAGVDGRRAHHLRRHAGDPGQGRVRASAAQPRHRRPTTRSSSARRRCERPSCQTGASFRGETLWVVGMGADSEVNSRATHGRLARRRSSCRCRAPCSSARATSRRSSCVNGPTDFDGVLTDDAGAVVGLWSSFAWESGRELQQENRGVAIGVVQDMLRRVQAKQAAVLARSRARAAAAGRGAPPRPVRRLAAQARDREPEPAAGAVHRAPGRRLARRRAAQAGRHPAGHRRQGGHASSARWSCAVADKPDGQRHRVARRRRADACRCRPAQLDGNDVDRIVHVGRRHAAGAASRDDRPARHPARGRVRRVISPMGRRPRVTGCSRAAASSRSTASPRPISTPSSRWSRAGRTVPPSGCARSPGTTRPK